METASFDNRPTVKKRLNILPANPEQNLHDRAVGPGRFPSWLHRKLPPGSNLLQTDKIMRDNRLNTVCEEAKCPNLLECWSKKTATYLVMGKECTRACGFCDIDFSKSPKDLEDDEAERLADSVFQLGLKHVVITMVARDDLQDGGAAHLCKIVQKVRASKPDLSIELLTSDFAGNQCAWKMVIDEEPQIFNHNIETVRELTPQVRNKATYERTLQLLTFAKQNAKKTLIKSGLMVGLGESDEQVRTTIKDLHHAGCDIITIGQYLQPNRHKLRVKSFVHPDQFKSYEQYGYELGVKRMHCGPFVRSSYNAETQFEKTLSTC